MAIEGELDEFVNIYCPHKDFTIQDLMCIKNCIECKLFKNLTFLELKEYYDKITNDDTYLKKNMKNSLYILAKEEFVKLNLIDCRPPCIQDNLIEMISNKFNTPNDVNNLILPFIPPKIHHCEIMKILIKYKITKLKTPWDRFGRPLKIREMNFILEEMKEWNILKKETKGLTKAVLKDLPLMPRLKSTITKYEMIEIYDKIIDKNGICILKNHPKFSFWVKNFLNDFREILW